jgi:hypothetical protein
MDIRNKRFVKVVYKIEGEEDKRTFLYEIDPDPARQDYPRFEQMMRNFYKLEGIEYEGQVTICSEEIIESKFIDDPKEIRRFNVEIPVIGMYTRQVDVQMSKYTHDRHQLDDVKYQAVYGAKVDVEHESLDMDKVYAIRVIDDVPNRVVISGEYPTDVPEEDGE